MDDDDLGCVLPGERLGSLNDWTPGEGTYVRHGHVYSTLAGCKHILQTSHQELPLISVKREERKNVVPEIGSVVTAKVISINPRFCRVSIMAVNATTMKETFRGTIRKEDVRATEKDRVEMYKCFRPGDILLARVMSLGDASSYQLTTAENELGVIFSQSEAGATMVPISWCEMQCPKTGTKEFRKVAKPVTVPT